MAIDRILFAIPSISAENKREILNICKETGCEVKNLPGVYQFVTGEVSVKVFIPFLNQVVNFLIV